MSVRPAPRFLGDIGGPIGLGELGRAPRVYPLGFWPLCDMTDDALRSLLPEDDDAANELWCRTRPLDERLEREVRRLTR